jgi:hypothetical protein
MRVNSGIFTYNASSIDSQIDAKQTIFTTEAIELNNTLNVHTGNINGGANKLYFGRDTLQSLFRY